MTDTRVDEHAVVHSAIQLLANWWIQWCYTRNEDGQHRDDEIVSGVPTCLACIGAERRFGRAWRTP